MQQVIAHILVKDHSPLDTRTWYGAFFSVLQGLFHRYMYADACGPILPQN